MLKNIGEVLSWVGVALITLVPIINPVSTAVLLLGISSHLSKEERNRQITRACIYMTTILVTFLLLGHLVMVAFGISIPGIRIAGGLVIGFLGFRMLFPGEGQITGEGKQEAQEKPDISFSPLAMPSLSGPGAIAGRHYHVIIHKRTAWYRQAILLYRSSTGDFHHRGTLVACPSGSRDFASFPRCERS